jgi:hypothetical protein
MANKSIVEKVNALSSYIEGKPGGWAAFEKTVENAPKVLQKELNQMMNYLAARRAMARPIPRDPPVMKIRFPASDIYFPF